MELYNAQGGECAVTGLPLLPPTHSRFHCQGSHILPKGTYPDYRLDPRNVVMVTQEKHDQWERAGDKDELAQQYPAWEKVVQTYWELRNEVNQKDRHGTDIRN